MVESSKHQELAHRQVRDSKGKFSLECTHTPPMGCPSTGSESNNESALEMWYVFDANAPAGNNHARVIIVRGGGRCSLSYPEPCGNDNFYYVMIDTSIFTYLPFNY
jgi:hypothetical protein